MVSETTCVPTLIEPGHSISIVDGEGTEVQGLEGAVWITQADDLRDIVLLAGETFTLDRPGLALLVALETPAVARIVSRGDRATLADLVSVGVIGAKSGCETSKADRRQALAA